MKKIWNDIKYTCEMSILVNYPNQINNNIKVKTVNRLLKSKHFTDKKHRNEFSKNSNNLRMCYHEKIYTLKTVLVVYFYGKRHSKSSKIISLCDINLIRK